MFRFWNMPWEEDIGHHLETQTRMWKCVGPLEHISELMPISELLPSSASWKRQNSAAPFCCKAQKAQSFQTPLSLIYIHSQAAARESITYLSCNKTFQGKCGYYAEAKTEAAERYQVVVSAVVLKYVSWKVNVRWGRGIWKIEKKKKSEARSPISQLPWV